MLCESILHHHQIRLSLFSVADAAGVRAWARGIYATRPLNHLVSVSGEGCPALTFTTPNLCKRSEEVV